MSLRRAVTRTLGSTMSSVSQPLGKHEVRCVSPFMSQIRTKTTARDQKRLGVYPVPPEAYIWWMNRSQVPGGQIQQSFSLYQQKVVWQYFWNGPQRWYWRLSKWTWPVFTPGLIFYIFFYKACEADVEEDIRAKHWY